MDGLSSAASVLAVVSLAIQLAENVKKLYEFWESIKEAPSNVCDINADLRLLSSVLSEIARDAQHVEADDTMIAVLESCTVKCNTLLTLVHDLESGLASTSSRIRKWTALKMAHKSEKLDKFHKILEGVKSTLLLALQNHHGHLSRIRHQHQQQHLIAILQGLSSVKLDQFMETVTTTASAPLEFDSHLKALFVETSRIASSIENPIYRIGFEKTVNKAIRDSLKGPDGSIAIGGGTGSSNTSSSSCQTTLELYGRHLSLNNSAWRRERIRHQESTSENLFGMIYIESQTYVLESRFSDASVTTPNACQYENKSSFIFHPAAWLINMGFKYGLRVGLCSSPFQTWKHTLNVSRPVPDDALIFEFCQGGNIAGVQSLLSRGEASVRDVDSLGRTALFFAAQEIHPKLCKLLIDAGADKRSPTYRPMGNDLIRDPLTATTVLPRYRAKGSLIDRIDTLRLFEDCMDFSDEDGPAWDLLVCLSNNTAVVWSNNEVYISLLLWILRSFGSDIKMNLDIHKFSGLLYWALRMERVEFVDNEEFVDKEEFVDRWLGIGSNQIDARGTPNGYSNLLFEIVYAVPTSHILRRNPNLHLLGQDIDFSPHLESPTSLAIYSAYAFYSWRIDLEGIEINFEDFVVEELKHKPLKDAGWKAETLLTLFQYEFRHDDEFIFPRHWCCGECSGDSGPHVQPYWLQITERIKLGLNPDIGPELECNPKGSIFDCIYDKDFFVCIWCWEKHKAEGYTWPSDTDDTDDTSSDTDTHSSEDEYSPFHIHT